MSQHYSGMPQFGTDHHVSPPYASLSSNATQASHSSPMYQQHTMQAQNHQVPIAQANDIRFNANMQVPAPPAPLPFPPSINPDLFKHFPPLPPPPPPMQFNSSPGTPVGFSHFPGHVGGMAPPFNPPSSTGIAEAPAGQIGGLVSNNLANQGRYYVNTQQDGASLPEASRHGQRENGSYVPFGAPVQQSGAASLTVTQENNDDESDMYDPAIAFRMPTSSVPYSKVRSPLAHMATSPFTNTAQTAVDPNSNTESSTPNVSQAELKEKAKAAILSLSSHRITYSNLLAEGLHPDLLQSLFNELGLDMSIGLLRISPPDVPKEYEPQSTVESSRHQTQTKAQDALNIENAKNFEVTPTGQPAVTKSGMERKDRIAQLLAAKAAKGNIASNKISPSASASPIPASASDIVLQQQVIKDRPNRPTSNTIPEHPTPNSTVDAVNSTEAMKQQLTQLKKMAGNLLQNASATGITTNSASLLPTPIRESLVETGLSSLIPGLFMRNEEEQSSGPSMSKLVGMEPQPVVDSDVTSTTLRQSRKRSADWLMDAEQNVPKRAAMPENDISDVEIDKVVSESGEASEGEIIEEDADQKPPPQQHGSEQSLGVTKESKADADNGHTPSYHSLRPVEKTFANSENVRSNFATSSPRPISRLTPAQLAERAAQLKADLLRQRRIRQQQLTDGMPALDEEVVKTQQRIEESKIKLAEIRGQLQKYEAEAIRARESERDLLEEIRRLELQLEEGMTGQKRFSDELKTIKSQASESSVGPGKPPQVQVSTSDRHPATSTAGNNEQSPLHHKGEVITAPDENDTGLSSAALVLPEQHNHTSNDAAKPASSSNSSRSTSLPSSRGYFGPNENEGDRGQTLEDQIQSQITNADSTTAIEPIVGNGISDVSEEDMDADLRSEDSRMSIDDDSDNESDGSASMSDSGSDDYEPAEHESKHLTETHRDESAEYEPEDDTAPPSQPDDDDDDADDYEPSESIAVAEASFSPTGQQQEFGPELPVTEDTELISRSAESLEQSTPLNSDVIPQANIDDQENTTQLDQADVFSKPQELLPEVQGSAGDNTGLETSLGTNPHYVPYQSPLSSFKSYRFHSSFSDQVKSGYRSLTYSNKIDPTRPICPTELTGSVCSDPNCEEQHFESMLLTDDKILVQMSDANDITDEALRNEYLGGLKQVIATLRTEGVKDFSEVANALSRYRRDWAVAHLTI